MSKPLVQTLEPWISRERIEAYRPHGGDDLAMIVTYLYNTALCEALYTALSFLEISLRNSLHTNLSALHGSASWYSLPNLLEKYDDREVRKVIRRIQGEGKRATPGRVVSELNFGFWVALLSTPYDVRFWRPQKAHYLKRAFPHILKRQRQRSTIHKRFNELRGLRNRVFHHETIWNRATLQRDYVRIYEAMEWISPDMAAICRLVDRFPVVVADGHSDIERSLKQYLQIE